MICFSMSIVLSQKLLLYVVVWLRAWDRTGFTYMFADLS